MTFMCLCSVDRRRLCVVVVVVQVGPYWIVDFPRVREVTRVDTVQIGTLGPFRCRGNPRGCVEVGQDHGGLEQRNQECERGESL